MSSLDKNLGVVILAGGLGTRLRSVLTDKPKVLARVNNRPFIEYILEQLNSFGFQEVFISIGYMADKVRQELGVKYKHLKLNYIYEQEPLGTGGAIKFAYNHILKYKDYLVLNGDSYVDYDFNSFYSWYIENNYMAGLLLNKVDDTSRFGRVELLEDCDQDGKIQTFTEKGCAGPGYINAGVYLLSEKSIKQIPGTIEKPVKYSIEQDLFVNLVRHGLFGYKSSGRFIDIGIPDTYKVADEFFG